MKSIKSRYKIGNKLPAIVITTVLICVLILTIGFASFSDQLSINAMAMVRADADIRVTNVTAINGTNGASTNWEEYHVKNITSAVNLPNANSTITYRIEVTNIGNVEQGIYDIDEIYKKISNNTNSDLEIKSTTINLKESLCDDSNSNKCKLGSVTTFDITIGYKNNGYDGTNITHSVELDFDFRRVFGITYVGFSGNTSGLPTQMIDGDTKIITFDNTSGIPKGVIVTGATGVYASPTLTLSNITIQNTVDTIVVTRAYSVTYIGFSGNTSGLLSTVTSSGGTITFNNTTGIPTSVTVIGATGSYTSPTLTLSNVTSDVTVANSYSVTYIDFTGNTSGLPSTIPATGGTITFNATSGIPANVTVTGATGSYTSPILTLSNISGNVSITATFNGTVEVIENDDGTTTTNTSTVTENPDGSTTTFINSVTTDSQGNTISSSEIETVENTNGTSTTTTINYDAQGNKTTGSTANTDTSGNINTQEVEYDAQDNPVVTGYTIDTSNNQNGGEIISGGLDTGMIAFDGRAFTIHIKARVNPADQGTTNVFVSALENVSNNKYSGFTVDIYNKRSIISFGGTNTQIKNAYFGSRVTGKVDNSTGVQELNYLKTGRQEIEINITYTPSVLNPEWKYIINAKQLYTSTTSSTKQSDAKSTMYSNSGYLPQSLSNATVVVGSYGVEHTHDMVNYEILEFDVHKI